MAMFRLGSAGQKRFLNFIYNEIKASQQCGALVLRFVSWYTIYCKSVKRLRYTLFTVPICAPLTKKQSTGLFFYTFVPPWGSSPFFIQIKKFTHLLVYELFWCERRDRAASRLNCLMTVTLCSRCPSAHHSLKNSPPDCFSIRSCPLGVQVPFLYK